MKYRDRANFTAEVFSDPQHIVRLDDRSTHGWQLRYGVPLRFSDHTKDGSGASAALAFATADLAKRIAKLPAPNYLKTKPMDRKTTDLPLGISGPIEIRRTWKNVAYYNFNVSVPIVGGKSTNKNVYIGTENTMNKERVALALAKAITLRESYVRKAKLGHTRTKRAKAVAAGLGDPQ